jgi:hypothetical protein
MEQPLAVNAENSRAKVQNVGGDSSAVSQLAGIVTVASPLMRDWQSWLCFWRYLKIRRRFERTFLFLWTLFLFRHRSPFSGKVKRPD